MSVPGMRTEVTGGMPRHMTGASRTSTAPKSPAHRIYNKYFGSTDPTRTGRSHRDLKGKYTNVPDPSYDLDGDGAVSHRDYFLAKIFDKDGDGKLNRKERSEALKAMSNGLAEDHIRDYFESASSHNRRRKCTVFDNVMKSTVRQQSLCLRDTFQRTLEHPGHELQQRPDFSTTISDMHMGERSRVAPEDLPARSAFLLRRKNQDRELLNAKSIEHQKRLDSYTADVNATLARLHRGPKKNKNLAIRTQRELEVQRREKLYTDRLKHVALKEGVLPTGRNGTYVGAIANLPESIGVDGMPTNINLARHPNVAYSEGKISGAKVMAKKRFEKSYENTRSRLFGLEHKSRKAMSSTARDFFKSSNYDFEPTDPIVDKSMPTKITHTQPIFHASNPYPKKVTSQASMTSQKYTHIDYMGLGRKLDQITPKVGQQR